MMPTSCDRSFTFSKAIPRRYDALAQRGEQRRATCFISTDTYPTGEIYLPNLSETRSWRDPIAVVLVSFYLVGVGIFLVLTRRIPAPPFRKVLRALVRKPYEGTVGDFGPEQ